MKLSVRAGIETPSGGGSVGISSGARKWWRKHFAGVQGMQGSNDQINYLIATDFASSQIVHRFILRSSEPASISKSNTFYYISVTRKNGRQDILVIQTAFKDAPEDIKKKRLTSEWLNDVLQGKIKRRTK